MCLNFRVLFITGYVNIILIFCQYFPLYLSDGNKKEQLPTESR